MKRGERGLERSGHGKAPALIFQRHLIMEVILSMKVLATGDDINGFWFSSGGLAVKFADPR